jgi:hypothetical protein
LVLGNIFYEAKGKITNTRIIDSKGPKTESSFIAYGKIKSDIEVMEIGTFWGIPVTGDNKVYGEDRDIIYVKEVNNNYIPSATARARVIGKPVSSSEMRFAGSVFFDAFVLGKLEFLNNVVGVFEAEVKDGINLSIRKWEWI